MKGAPASRIESDQKLPARFGRHPTGERAVRRELLHLLRDFSQLAILRHMSGNSADISKAYFEKPIGSLNPLWSASKSLILQYKMSRTQLRRHFRRLATAVAEVSH